MIFFDHHPPTNPTTPDSPFPPLPLSPDFPPPPPLTLEGGGRCNVIFFHHLEKTGGTTVRSVLQRQAQLGHFDFISFVNRFDKLQLQAT